MLGTEQQPYGVQAAKRLFCPSAERSHSCQVFVAGTGWCSLRTGNMAGPIVLLAQGQAGQPLFHALLLTVVLLQQDLVAFMVVRLSLIGLNFVQFHSRNSYHGVRKQALRSCNSLKRITIKIYKALSVPQRAKQFACFISFKPHNGPVRQVLYLFPF